MMSKRHLCNVSVRVRFPLPASLHHFALLLPHGLTPPPLSLPLCVCVRARARTHVRVRFGVAATLLVRRTCRMGSDKDAPIGPTERPAGEDR